MLVASVSVLLNFLSTIGITHDFLAKALAMLAATPLFTSGFDWVFLGKRLSKFTWVVITAVVSRIGGIVGDALARSSALGVMVTIGASLFWAIYFNIFGTFLDIIWLHIFVIAGDIAATISSRSK